MTATFRVALVEMADRYANLNHFLELLRIAFPRGFVRLEGGNLVGLALEAADAFRPPGSGHISQALLFCTEGLLDFYQA